MNEQPLDLRASLKSIWRHRFLVVVLAIIGAVGGVAYGISRPPMPSAISLVLLPESDLTAAGTPTIDIDTQIVIATSNPVLEAAGTTVSPPVGTLELKRRVKVTAIGQDILQIQVSDKSPQDAERLANAVAFDYIQYVNSSPSSPSGSLAGLQHESSDLTQEIQSLQSQIDTVSARLAGESSSSANGQEDASLLGTLGDEQRQLSVQLDNVNNQIISSQQSGTLIGGVTRLLQRAVTLAPASKLRLPLDAMMGIGAGLIAGVIFILVRWRRDQRLRLRSEIAGALGVPVLGSVHAESCKTSKAWSQLLENYDPSSVDAWALRKIVTRVGLGLSDFGDLRVIAFSEDLPALAVGPQLAAFASRLGISLSLVPDEDPTLVQLRAACAVRNGSSRPGQPPPGQGHSGNGADRSTVTVSVVTLDASRPIIPPSLGANLLAISAGFATAEMLARLALAAADASQVIDGIVIVNPESDDATSGTIAEVTSVRRERERSRRNGAIPSPVVGERV